MKPTRRDFLKMGMHTGAGMLFLAPATRLLGNETLDTAAFAPLAASLLEKWGAGFLSVQVNQPALKGIHGGLLCPACATVHGRSMDAILCLLWLADRKKDHAYINAALKLYNWTEETVSLPDGSWSNEIVVSSWKGTTVFGAVTLATALQHYGHLLPAGIQQKWKRRLHRAGEFLYNDFTIDTGNINYPMAGSYALSLLGQQFNEPGWIEKGKTLAHQCLRYFTPNNRLIFGEGKPVPEKSARGCYSVDLGYNVEESLPSLVLYSKLTGDAEVMETVQAALLSHLEFMLPDGAWDNSWGTRNFKWTYWGSRTSDGCQPAYALMTDKNPVFLRAAIKNTELLNRCTHDKFLYGGLHNHVAGMPPCIHHAFGHSKALVTALLEMKGKPSPTAATALLPREQEYDVRYFPDIRTWLIARRQWRATITAYDVEYSMKAGHASGGALSMLWHQEWGPVLAAGMSRYQLVEPFNMQKDKPEGNCLTPRFELVQQGKIYMNIQDLNAEVIETGNVHFKVKALLVDEDGGMPVDRPSCELHYEINDAGFRIKAGCAAGAPATFHLPVICEQKAELIPGSQQIDIRNNGKLLRIKSDKPFRVEGQQQRLFNFVPGLQAIDLRWQDSDIDIEIKIT